jgi:hypothetical protein
MAQLTYLFRSPMSSSPEREGGELIVATPTSSPIKTKTRTIDGLSIRYAESAPRELSAILLSPWPESLYTFGHFGTPYDLDCSEQLRNQRATREGSVFCDF